MPERIIEGEYDDATYELIEQLNLENWIHYHKEIVKLVYHKPITSEDIKRVMGDDYNYKVIRSGIGIGVLSKNAKGRANRYDLLRLTEKAMKYYEEHMEDNDT